jgi:hypothetical protein
MVLPATTMVLPVTMGGGTGTSEVAQRPLRRHRQREVRRRALSTARARGGRVCQALAAGSKKAQCRQSIVLTLRPTVFDRHVHPLPLRRAMGFEPQRRYKVSFRRSIDGTL